MAARDRNLSAWMAYVIVASIVSLGLIGALGWAIYNNGHYQTAAREMQNRATESDKKYRDIATNLDYFKAMLGQRQFTEAEWQGVMTSVSGQADVDAMQKQFSKDMTLFGPSEPLQNKNYPKLAEYLMAELRARNQQVDSAAKKEQELNLKTENIVKTETEAREKAEQKSNELDKQLAEARADFKIKIDEQVKLNTQTNETLQKKIQEHGKEKSKLEATVKAKTEESKTFSERNLALVRRIEILEKIDFQAAQGKVIDVRDGGQIVYINLGFADDLRAGVRFSVLNPDIARLTDAKPKAHIEIVEVIGDHQARGKLLSTEMRAPVVKGDVIYSPVWSKGRKVHFAFMGKLDIDGDGADDRNKLRALVEQSGGVIDEDLSPDGKSNGKMSADTRWLVVGEKFDVNSNDELDPKIKEFRSKYADMQSRARGLAVSQINLDKLLSWITSAGEDRTVPLGNAARASDFVEPRTAKISNGSVSEVYSQYRKKNPLIRPIDPNDAR